MMRIAICLVAASLTAGCAAGSNMHNRMLEDSGDVRVDPTGGPGYDIVVTLKNKIDIGYDPDDKTSRETTALGFVQADCPGARIVGESVATTGSYLTRPAKVYAIKIKCRATG